jgi:Cysteine-rich secretory protein family
MLDRLLRAIKSTSNQHSARAAKGINRLFRRLCLFAVGRPDVVCPFGGHHSYSDGNTAMRDHRYYNVLFILFWLLFGFCTPAPAQAASPAELISNYRLQHGEGRVTTDSTLSRIAHEQAAAMAAKDVLDHGVLGPFSSRVAPAGSRRAAENIAYGYDSFGKTLDQWIESSGHRSNLLLHGASRVGIASAKSSKSGRTYWAMVIAGTQERPKQVEPKAGAVAKNQVRVPEDCRIKLLSLCL